MPTDTARAGSRRIVRPAAPDDPHALEGREPPEASEAPSTARAPKATRSPRSKAVAQESATAEPSAPDTDAVLAEAFADPDFGLALRLVSAFADRLAARETPTNLDALTEALGAPFPADAVEWKPQTVTRDKTKALAVAYLKNRAIQDRLDAVCGAAGWRNEYRPGPAGGVVCGISVRVVFGSGRAEWVTKWDGADNTQIEPTKGGLSDSMKRAAVQWGIGRLLYRLPAQWVPIDDRGAFKRRPEVPPAFLPKTADGKVTRQDDAERRSAEGAFHATGIEWVKIIRNLVRPAAEWDAQRPRMIEHYCAENGIEVERNSASELTTEQLRELTAMLRDFLDMRRPPKRVLTETKPPPAPEPAEQYHGATEPTGPPPGREEDQEPFDDYPLTAEERESAEERGEGPPWVDDEGWPR